MKRFGRIRHMGTLHAALILLVRIAGLSAAALWRRLMVRTTFVAITGSVGKTTAKECIAAALATRNQVASTFGSQNHFNGIFRTLMRVRPWHRYAVVEIGLDGPGQMKWFACVVKPDIAVWMGAARAHTDRFKSLEQTAAEKSLLVRTVRPPGWAVLNADNPYSAACVPPAGVRAIRFGTDESAEVRATGAASAWPDRLSFELHADGESFPVRTRLIGTHWTPSVLAGFAVGQALRHWLE
ncbi:MAG: Mur ligase family protein [Bryobacteraceae bacterium]